MTSIVITTNFSLNIVLIEILLDLKHCLILDDLLLMPADLLFCVNHRVISVIQHLLKPALLEWLVFAEIDVPNF